MRILFNKGIVLILFTLSTLLLCCFWELFGVVLYADWVVNRRISHWTEQHKAELLQPITRYVHSFTLNGYPDSPDEFDEYAAGPVLRGLEAEWQRAQAGESVTILTDIDIDLASLEVVAYTGQTARVLLKQQLKIINYTPTGVEVVDENYRTGLYEVQLILEDDVWKVYELNGCGLQQQDCINNIRRQYDRFSNDRPYGLDYSLILKVGNYFFD